MGRQLSEEQSSSLSIGAPGKDNRKLGNTIGCVNVSVKHTCVNKHGWRGKVEGRVGFIDGLGKDAHISWGENGQWYACPYCEETLPPTLKLGHQQLDGIPEPELEFDWSVPKG